MLRKFIVALSVVGFLVGSINESKAGPLPAVVPAVAASSVGAGFWIAGGVFGVVVALIVYDIKLKIDGVKNWDGTPKSGKAFKISENESPRPGITATFTDASGNTSPFGINRKTPGAGRR